MILKKIKIKLNFIYYKLVDRLINLFVKPPNVQSIDKTMDKIINEKCSVARYGDGEFKVINGTGNGFQRADDKLALKLKSILLTEEEKFIVCLPDIFSDLSIYKTHAQLFWKEYLIFNRYKIYRLLKKNKLYYNSFVTRLYMDWLDQNKSKSWFIKLKQVWDKRDVVIIEGEGSRLGVGNDIFDNANSISRILAPAENAFDKYDSILEEVSSIDKSSLVLIALGQTATVLAYDLYKLGYQAIDIGHLDIEYEWFLMKAEKKVSIPNKYVNEAQGGKEFTEIEDIEYLNQIICEIK